MSWRCQKRLMWQAPTGLHSESITWLGTPHRNQLELLTIAAKHASKGAMVVICHRCLTKCGQIWHCDMCSAECHACQQITGTIAGLHSDRQGGIMHREGSKCSVLVSIPSKHSTLVKGLPDCCCCTLLDKTNSTVHMSANIVSFQDLESLRPGSILRSSTSRKHLYNAAECVTGRCSEQLKDGIAAMQV